MSTPTLVSVQLSTAPDVVSGHLAWGELLDVDLVVVPGPIDWLGSSERIEVLVGSPESAFPVQRFGFRDALDVGFPDNPEGRSATLRLQSPVLGVTLDGRLDSEALQQALRETSDVWAAMEISGWVSPETRFRSVETLIPIGEQEQLQRETLPRKVDLGLRGWSIWCLFTPRCRPNIE